MKYVEQLVRYFCSSTFCDRFNSMSKVTWILESEVFPDTHSSLRQAIINANEPLIDWSDRWWTDGIPTSIPNKQVVFHGSLGNAARIEEQLGWSPGSFCPVDNFRCSVWYENARPWLVHPDWLICPAIELVTNATRIANELQSNGKLFVRPDSPLKPFSGRVVETNALTLTRLDHGFYYDDETLPVVVAPVQEIGDEWRFIVVNQQVVTGSAYDAVSRKPKAAALESDAALFASTVASTLVSPSIVYILDVCRCNDQFRLLELNPFGGADIYACDADAIVEHVSHVAFSKSP